MVKKIVKLIENIYKQKLIAINSFPVLKFNFIFVLHVILVNLISNYYRELILINKLSMLSLWQFLSTGKISIIDSYLVPLIEEMRIAYHKTMYIFFY